jgi:hypothetical protein
MGTDRHRKYEKGRLPPFVPLLIDTLDCSAWRAMSHGAQMLYVALKRRYSSTLHNNGRVYLSQRLARAELRSGFSQIARWYRELQHYGFIVMVTPGTLGIQGRGLAPRWRLTECGCNREMPTRDFLGWDGTQFTDIDKKSRTRKLERGVPENRSIQVLRESIAPQQESAPESSSKYEERAFQKSGADLDIPLGSHHSDPERSDGVVQVSPWLRKRSPRVEASHNDLEIPEFLRRTA